MKKNTPSLVSLLGRRYICKHKAGLADLFNLTYPDRRLVRDIKIRLRDRHFLSVLKTKFGLAQNCTDNELRDRIRRRVQRFDIARGFGLNKMATDDELCKALYFSVMGH